MEYKMKKPLVITTLFFVLFSLISGIIYPIEVLVYRGVSSSNLWFYIVYVILYLVAIVATVVGIVFGFKKKSDPRLSWLFFLVPFFAFPTMLAIVYLRMVIYDPLYWVAHSLCYIGILSLFGIGLALGFRDRHVAKNILITVGTALYSVFVGYFFITGGFSLYGRGLESAFLFIALILLVVTIWTAGSKEKKAKEQTEPISYIDRQNAIIKQKLAGAQKLLIEGVISPEEYEAMRKKILGI